MEQKYKENEPTEKPFFVEESFREMYKRMKQVKGRKVRGEQDLSGHLEVSLEQVDEEAQEKTKQMDKATKKSHFRSHSTQELTGQ